MIHSLAHYPLLSPLATKFNEGGRTNSGDGCGGSKFDNHPNNSCCVDAAHGDQLLRRARAHAQSRDFGGGARARVRAPACDAR